MSDFNPRTREGCDGVTDDVGVWLDVISIHAPVKGATFLATSMTSQAF